MSRHPEMRDYARSLADVRCLLVDSDANYPSNPLFAEPLEELSVELRIPALFINEAAYVTRTLRSRILHHVSRRTGRQLLGRALNIELVTAAKRTRANLAIVVKGSYIARPTVEHLKELGCLVVNYATDDPLSAVATTPALTSAISAYDIVFSTKRAIIPDLVSAGCTDVRFLPFGYKPSVHFPEHPTSAEELATYSSDLAFVGGADDDRVHLVRGLVRAFPQLRIRLFGGYWDRYPDLAPYWHGYVFGRQFRLTVATAAISLNLVRHSNRDGHVMRSFELPACRGFVLAERTAEHEDLFLDGVEAVYFDDATSCLSLVETYLNDPEARARIALAGYHAVRAQPHTYKDRLLSMVAQSLPMLR